MDEYDWADQERLVRQDVEEIEKQMADYPDFVSSTGYGTGEGLGGWNCYH